MKLIHKSVLITGGVSGIGLEAVKQYLAEGMKVFICGKTASKLQDAKQKYPSITAIPCDINLDEEVYNMKQLINDAGGIDILHNNAGIVTVYDLAYTGNRIASITRQEIETNYLATVRLKALFLPDLMRREEAAIINTSSAVAYLPATFIPNLFGFQSCATFVHHFVA